MAIWDEGQGNLLWPANAPWALWRLIGQTVDEADWSRAAAGALSCLSGLPLPQGEPVLSEIIAGVLGERWFGPDHWRLSGAKRLYYRLRPYLPAQARPVIRRLFQAGRQQGFALGWPIEDRYVRFQFEMVRQLLINKGLASLPFIHFWPAGKSFAFVLTHDVEGPPGRDFVLRLAAIEERYGFRSSFNFVPELYHVDRKLREELIERGFEVGVHGLKHDGRLFSSQSTFRKRAACINDYVHDWSAAGFRSPMTHRHPEWMQMLDVSYDASFFDTDPFEPIAGGTMSIWPFCLGRFVEMPYTLAQDHTLMVTLGESTARIWLEKADFVAQNYGMVLVNTHPDYLQLPQHLAIYEEFLDQMSARPDSWATLPRQAANWWLRRARTAVEVDGDGLVLPGAPEGTIGEVSISEQGVKIHACRRETQLA